MIPYNYHTHTKRCGHAIGEDEDYVLEAIAAGVRVLGFSDHIMQPGVIQPGIRGEFEELEDYLQSINALKEKYKDRITILVGFEAEYAPAFVDYYKELLGSKRVDYLILGQHYKYEGKTIVKYFGNVRDKDMLYEYADLVVEAIKTGLFKCVAHPDLFMASYPKYDMHVRKASYDICDAATKYDVALEINLGGFRYGLKEIGGERRYSYPFPGFWTAALKKKSKVIIGVDAHSPSDFRSNEFSIGLRMIRAIRLKYITDLMEMK